MRTAEFVTPKHPDKVCDIISDTLVDMVLKKDPAARCNIRTMGGYGKVWVTGEVSSTVDDSEIKNIIYDISGVTDTTIYLQTAPSKSSYQATTASCTSRSRYSSRAETAASPAH